MKMYVILNRVNHVQKMPLKLKLCFNIIFLTEYKF